MQQAGQLLLKVCSTAEHIPMQGWRIPFLRISTPKGQLTGGKKKVSGVVSEEVYLALVRFMGDQNLTNMSRTVGAALRTWLEGYRVQNPVGDDEGSR